MLQAFLRGPTDESQAAAWINDGSPWARTWLGLGAGLKLLLDPNDTRQVFYLARALDRDSLARLRDQLAQTAAGRDLLERRPAIDRTSIDFDALRALPAETLGGAYVRMLDQKGLTPDIFQRPPGLPEDQAYVAQRARQTHDLWHVLTGLGTDVVGEIALQAFTYAQLKLRLSRHLSVAGVLFFSPRHPRLFKQARLWFERGRRATFLLAVPFEARFSEPLDALRAELGIIPAA